MKKYHLQSGFDVPKTNSILYPLSDYIYWLLHHTLSRPIVSDFMSVQPRCTTSLSVHHIQGVPTSFRQEALKLLVTISKPREIRILIFFVRKIRQIEGISELECKHTLTSFLC